MWSKLDSLNKNESVRNRNDKGRKDCSVLTSFAIKFVYVTVLSHKSEKVSKKL